MRRLFAVLWLLLPTVALASSPSDTLSNLLEEIWQYELKVSPTYATSMGVHDYDDQLADNSADALAAQNRSYSAFLERLQAIDSAALTRSEQITVMMQQRRLQNYLDEYRFNAHFVPITSEYGFHSAIAMLPQIARFKTAEDVSNYLKRLAAIGPYFDQQIAWMREGMKVNMVQPKAVLAGFEDSVQPFFEGSAEDSPFYTPLQSLPDAIGDAQQASLQAQAREHIAQVVMPAYQRFYQFLVDEYIPQAKTGIAASQWPQGKAYYQNRAEYYTTTSLSADEIHAIGVEEVARIRGEMQQVIDELGFEGDINAFIHFLRTDPQFYAPSAQALLKHAAYYSKKIDGLLPKLFYTLPRTPYGVAPVPESIAPKYTTGRYISPTRDDEPGYYWVNTYALDKRPLYAIPALTLHEAVPGHHLQISLAREMSDLPPVRRYTYISAFGEGWGLYSEYLGKEIGFYETPYDEFGRLSYEMWRACRLVVDTGMHMKGWTRQQALDYMMENTALSAHNVKTEIDRYISWPAQALSYKIGELEIKRLRQLAEQRLGERFDLRAFHDAVLAHGSVPLSVLADNIEQFIQQHQGTPSH
ncbi:DUF885 domain-containing protein [Aestuariibacter halophilus]|uniref:DUF885 domain-containing protein n=1 Tax=Fluctibacter halophilus TaxID=226011 RepID=A0ABS8GAF3_9ALTE|nr:DUF885 domain-containing protein [Aestuariibacter halophilus]MCC2617498.1 DUF885 domain-containing protein [Aestuariibacter halophilus]